MIRISPARSSTPRGARRPACASTKTARPRDFRRRNISFQEADIEQLPFAADAFNVVCCSFALGHIPRPEASLAECMRVLEPGGRIAFSWWDDPSRQRIQGIFREALTELRVAPPPGAAQGHD